MARINSNVAAITARVNLNRAQNDLETRFQRLATGLRINRGADDPAGLIVSERLRSEIEGITQGIKNSDRASNVIATTEGSLQEVSDLLNSIKALVVEAANTGAFSKEEIAANQLQVDSAIDSITRISNTATFGGLKLLNGELGYILSGVNNTDLAKAKVNSVAFADRTNVPIDIDIIGSAQPGQIFLRSDFATYVGGTAVDGTLPESTQVEIQGNDGVVVLQFTSGQTMAQIRDAINGFKSTTGVSASLLNGDPASALVFASTGYGTDSFISVRQLSGGANLQFGKINNNAEYDGANLAYGTGVGEITNVTGNANLRDEGKDVVALINGVLTTGNGLDVAVRTQALDVELELTETFAKKQVPPGDSTQFTVTGGGSIFQLGPQVNSNQQVNIGIDSVAATRLGGTLLPDSGGTNVLMFLESLKSGGANALGQNPPREQFASSILDTAIDEIATVRGRLGAFERNVLQTNVNSLEAAFENITAAESSIRDADFAFETSALTRAQVLTQAGTSVLTQANANSQNVLQLLG